MCGIIELYELTYRPSAKPASVLYKFICTRVLKLLLHDLRPTTESLPKQDRPMNLSARVRANDQNLTSVSAAEVVARGGAVGQDVAVGVLDINDGASTRGDGAG